MKSIMKFLAFLSCIAGIFAGVYLILKRLGYICDCDGECDCCDSYDECFGESEESSDRQYETV